MSNFQPYENVYGWLKKKKSHSVCRIFGNTNTRWFELKFNEHIFGYKIRKNDSHFKKKMDIKLIKNYEPFVKKKDMNLCEWLNGFQLKFVHQTYILFAYTKEEFEKWGKAFMFILGKDIIYIKYNRQFSENKNKLKIYKNNKIESIHQYDIWNKDKKDVNHKENVSEKNKYYVCDKSKECNNFNVKSKNKNRKDSEQISFDLNKKKENNSKQNMFCNNNDINSLISVNDKRLNYCGKKSNFVQSQNNSYCFNNNIFKINLNPNKDSVNNENIHFIINDNIQDVQYQNKILKQNLSHYLDEQRSFKSDKLGEENESIFSREQQNKSKCISNLINTKLSISSINFNNDSINYNCNNNDECNKSIKFNIFLSDSSNHNNNKKQLSIENQFHTSLVKNIQDNNNTKKNIIKDRKQSEPLNIKNFIKIFPYENDNSISSYIRLKHYNSTIFEKNNQYLNQNQVKSYSSISSYLNKTKNTFLNIHSKIRFEYRSNNSINNSKLNYSFSNKSISDSSLSYSQSSNLNEEIFQQYITYLNSECDTSTIIKDNNEHASHIKIENI